ncbi:hypothetical protein REPUB_Repub03eG0115100 [Reevesia pubescens]
MGSDSQFWIPRIPIIELTIKSKDLGRGTDGWKSLCQRVREACENYGCFEVVYDKISSNLRAGTFSLIRELINLPFETKRKNINPKPLHGYYEPGSDLLPFYESFGIEDASNCNFVKSFLELMWTQGHDQYFCQTINTLMKELEELSHIIGLMIIDSYGLEIETKDGEWVKLCPSPLPSSLSLEILSRHGDGRMHAANHRVMFSGDKDRHSLGAFAVPVEGTIIKAPKEMVDEEHPQVFKDFDFVDFVNYANSEGSLRIDSAKKLFMYAAQPGKL